MHIVISDIIFYSHITMITCCTVSLCLSSSFHYINLVTMSSVSLSIPTLAYNVQCKPIYTNIGVQFFFQSYNYEIYS